MNDLHRFLAVLSIRSVPACWGLGSQIGSLGFRVQGHVNPKVATIDLLFGETSKTLRPKPKTLKPKP